MLASPITLALLWLIILSAHPISTYAGCLAGMRACMRGCRGMQCTSYVKMAPGTSVEDLRAALIKAYEGEPFVKVLDKGVIPHTRHVRGSNFCLMNVFEDRLSGRAIIISVIDNLVKGASGQGLQNLNLMMGWPETTALMQLAMFP